MVIYLNEYIKFEYKILLISNLHYISLDLFKITVHMTDDISVKHLK